jgi:hypothetical protein
MIHKLHAGFLLHLFQFFFAVLFHRLSRTLLFVLHFRLYLFTWSFVQRSQNYAKLILHTGMVNLMLKRLAFMLLDVAHLMARILQNFHK